VQLVESVFFLCLTQHVEGRFIVHDLTSSSKEIHVSGFYPVVAACSVLFLSFEPLKADRITCCNMHTLDFMISIFADIFVLCVSE